MRKIGERGKIMENQVLDIYQVKEEIINSFGKENNRPY